MGNRTRPNARNKAVKKQQQEELADCPPETTLRRLVWRNLGVGRCLCSYSYLQEAVPSSILSGLIESTTQSRRLLKSFFFELYSCRQPRCVLSSTGTSLDSQQQSARLSTPPFGFLQPRNQLHCSTRAIGLISPPRPPLRPYPVRPLEPWRTQSLPSYHGARARSIRSPPHSHCPTSR